MTINIMIAVAVIAFITISTLLCVVLFLINDSVLKWQKKKIKEINNDQI